MTRTRRFGECYTALKLLRPVLMRGFVLIVLLLLAPNSIARVYQWVSPETGSVQLSGEPPSWYRSGRAGPRVWVVDNGRLVDDTAIALSVEQNAALREEAFAEVEARRLEAIQRLEDEIIREASRRERREAQQDAVASFDLSEQEEAREEELPPEVDEETIRQLKAIISDWDRRNLNLTPDSAE